MKRTSPPRDRTNYQRYKTKNWEIPIRRKAVPHPLLQERWSRIFTVFDNGQSNIVSRRPRRLAYGRRIRCMRRRVIVDLASAGPLEVKFIITLRRSTPVIEYRRFELGPPGESKLPLSNRKYTDFWKFSIIRISISFWIFIEDFAYYFTTNRTFLVG